MKVVPLFPTPLGLIDLGEVHNWQDNKLVDAVFRAQQADPDGDNRSQVGGWHSHPLSSFDPSFEELCVLVKEYGQTYLQHLGFSNEIQTVDCWANVNKKGNFNMMHHHNGSLLGGVYYPVRRIENGTRIFNYDVPTTPKPGSWSGEGGELTLQSPNYNLSGHLDTSDIGAYTMTHCHIQPRSGLLVLFPAYLVHSVVPVQDDYTRVSIAFSFV